MTPSKFTISTAASSRLGRDLCRRHAEGAKFIVAGRACAIVSIRVTDDGYIEAELEPP